MKLQTQVAQRHRYDVGRYRHGDVVTTSPMHHGPTSSRHPDDMATIWRRCRRDVVTMPLRCENNIWQYRAKIVVTNF